MLTIGETRSGVYRTSLYYLCNVPVNLKLFYNKKFTFKKRERLKHNVWTPTGSNSNKPTEKKGPLEEITDPTLRQGIYKVSRKPVMPENKVSKTDRDIAKSHRSKLEGPPISKILDNLRIKKDDSNGV